MTDTGRAAGREKDRGGEFHAPPQALPAFRPGRITAPILYTNWLVLRPPRLRDIPQVYRCLKDPDMRAFVRNLPRFTWWHAAQFVIKATLGRWRRRRVDYLMFRRDTGELVGCRSAFAIRHGPPRSAELASWVAKPYWGSRLSGEGGDIVLPYLWHSLGIHRFIMLVDEHNTKALRSLRRPGAPRPWQEEGLLRDHVRRGDRYGNFYLFSYLRTDPGVAETLEAVGLRASAGETSRRAGPEPAGSA